MAAKRIRDYRLQHLHEALYHYQRQLENNRLYLNHLHRTVNQEMDVNDTDGPFILNDIARIKNLILEIK